MPRKPKIPTAGKPVPPMTRLKKLPLADREKIYQWTLDLKGEEARKQIVAEYDIRLSSDSQLSLWRSWQFQQRRMESLNSVTEQFEEFYAKANPAASREVIRQMGIAFFMSEAANRGDAEGFHAFASLDIKDNSAKTKALQEEKKLNISERRLQLLEAKAAQADQAKEVLDGPKTPEEKQAAIRAIFGM
jgi:hypothetical protein